MKKRKNINRKANAPEQNPVAKYAHQFNKAHIFKDKSKYDRKAQHAKQEDFPIALISDIGKSFCLAYHSAFKHA